MSETKYVGFDLNRFAKDVTLKEGKKKSLSIAQVKEVIKITLTELANMDEKFLNRILKRYKV